MKFLSLFLLVFAGFVCRESFCCKSPISMGRNDRLKPYEGTKSNCKCRQRKQDSFNITALIFMEQHWFKHHALLSHLDLLAS